MIKPCKPLTYRVFRTESVGFEPTHPIFSMIRTVAETLSAVRFFVSHIWFFLLGCEIKIALLKRKLHFLLHFFFVYQILDLATKHMCKLIC